MSKLNRTRYYVLFATHEQAMALHDLLDQEGVRNRIAPAPRVLQGELSCGVSLMIEEEDVPAVEACIKKHDAKYHTIAPLSGELQSKRDRYC